MMKVSILLATFASVILISELSGTYRAESESNASDLALLESDNGKLSIDLTTLFRSARKVISDNQGLINDAERGDKGLSPEVVVSHTKENYKNASGKAIENPDTSTKAGRAEVAMLASIREVMVEAQDLINEKGKGFKGFLPAIFARLVADSFNEKMRDVMRIKLTAPKNYTRNRSNRPDKWEHGVIESRFRTEDWKKSQPFAEISTHKGKDAFRLLLPEYYGPSCLKCHGDPKGERDITGGKKEGGKLGELGGAISIVIYN